MQSPSFMSTPDAAKYLCVSSKVMEKWRVTGDGPPFMRLGGKIRGRIVYKIADLDSWANDRRRTSTSDPGLAT